MLKALLHPRTYLQVYEFVDLRRWEFKLMHRDSIHQRQGWLAYFSKTNPMYYFGGMIFMMIAGIDIVASMGSELVNGGVGGIDKAEEFARMVNERKQKQGEKRKQFDVVRSTAESARAGGFPRE